MVVVVVVVVLGFIFICLYFTTGHLYFAKDVRM